MPPPKRKPQFLRDSFQLFLFGRSRNQDE
jgi:hypothetical protein